jgi:polysaccharide export outer membrane protein
MVYVGLLMLFFSISSCKLIYPNLMFKKKKGDGIEYVKAQRENLIDEYVIQPYDMFQLQVFTREGMDIVDVLSQGNVNLRAGGMVAGRGGIPFLVEKDGRVEIPILGMVPVQGLTENQLEDQLEEEFAYYFVDPFVRVTVTNRRVFIFRGSQGGIVALREHPTTLFEVLAQSGGIPPNLKAYDIKIIRGDLKDPEVYRVDLSTFQGMKEAELIVQTNDIIYIDPRRRFVRDLTGELASLLSSVGVILSAVGLIVALNR